MGENKWGLKGAQVISFQGDSPCPHASLSQVHIRAGPRATGDMTLWSLYSYIHYIHIFNGLIVFHWCVKVNHVWPYTPGHSPSPSAPAGLQPGPAGQSSSGGSPASPSAPDTCTEHRLTRGPSSSAEPGDRREDASWERAGASCNDM